MQVRNTLKINLKQAATLVRNCGSSNTFIMRGQPGVGKSDILKTLKRELPDYLPCYIDVANLDLGDLGLHPMHDSVSAKTKHALFF